MPNDLRVSIDPAQLVSFCQTTQRSYASVLSRPWLQDCSVLMSYEQLVADADEIFAHHVCPLLGIADQRPQTDLRKQNTVPLEERVANYDEIQDVVRSSICHQQHRWPGATNPSSKAA